MTETEMLRGVGGEAMSSKKQRAVEALAEFANNDVRCDDCGKPATCIGSYEGQKETFPCCDACCGHGNEDGWCVLLNDLDAESVLEFSPPGPVVLLPHQRTTALAAIISSRLRMDATNDAARAELRARDMRYALTRIASFHGPTSITNVAANEVLAAAPDSDARLREVMERAYNAGYDDGADPDVGNDAAAWVDEALGVKS